MSRPLTRFFVAFAIAALCSPAPLRATDVDGPNDCQRPNQDFGDAPEGTAVLAYPGIPGRFPTCITPGPIGTQTVACAPISTAPGLAGYVQHSSPTGVPVYWLGCGAAAPMGVDSESDGKVNNSAVPGAASACSAIPTDCVEAAFGLSFGQDECYGSTDAGVLRPNLRTCKPATVTFTTTNCAAAPRTVYLNILVDMNRDGDWNDNFQCVGACAYEWAVKNASITLPTGCATLTSPAFLVGPNAGQGWMRVTISDDPVNDDYPWAGSVTMGGLRGGETEDYPVAIRKPATVTLSAPDISWVTIAPGIVRFHLTFRNEDPDDQSEPASGELRSQQFGVFQPSHGTIGTFNVPPLAPSSFFDVFFDARTEDLPPTAVEVLPWQGMIAARAGRAAPAGVTPGCPPDDHWDGNVDVNWSSASGGGQVNKHIGTLQVCPAHGNSYIHALVFCTDPAGASWSITGLCPGWSATLVNEGPPLVPDGPAPNPVPPGWTGFICISADGSVPPGAACPMQVTFTCNGVDGVIDLEPVACDCIQQSCDLAYTDFGDAPEEVDAYPGGIVGLFPTCTFGVPAGVRDVVCAPISTAPGATNGYVKHTALAGDPNMFWLGCSALGPSIDSEGDGKMNATGLGASVCATAVTVDCAQPAFGGAMTFGQDECWGDADAGVIGPVTFTACASTTLDIKAYNCRTQSDVQGYLNVLVDWNADGDWNDNFLCGTQCAYEWSVKNLPVVLLPGCTTLTPTVLAGPNAGPGWMRVTITASPVPDDFPWAGSAGLAGGTFRGGETEDYPVAIQGQPDPCDQSYRDFGDAPEELTAYSNGVAGHFPTCIFATGPGTQTVDCGAPLSTPPGPTGYVMHVSPATAAQKVWLGCGLPGTPGLGVDSEADGKVNTDPPFGLASACDPNVLVDCFEPAWLNFGQDECYGTPDAAIASPMTFHTCRDTVVTLTAYNCGTDTVGVHLNVLVDWNGDGDWNDVVKCSQLVPCRPEWALKNRRVVLLPGCNTLSVKISAGPRAGEAWMRVTLTIGTVADDFPWNGSLGEPNQAYFGGETEDYPVRIAQSFTDVEPETPGGLEFAPLTPNPSRDGTSARFTLPRDGDASLVVYDLAGRTVRVLLQRWMPAGEQHLLWDFRDDQGRAVPAGLYLVKLRVGADVFTRRVIKLN